jgi:hypothetical protein
MSRSLQSSEVGEQTHQPPGALDLDTPGLFVAFSRDGLVQVGTCGHCVVREKGRPPRAWNPDQQESELDFNRDELLRLLAALGVQLTIVDQYVCP